MVQKLAASKMKRVACGLLRRRCCVGLTEVNVLWKRLGFKIRQRRQIFPLKLKDEA